MTNNVKRGDDVNLMLTEILGKKLHGSGHVSFLQLLYNVTAAVLLI